MTFSLAFLIGALVLFILAALFFFGVGDVALTTSLGLVAAGLASATAAKLPLP